MIIFLFISHFNAATHSIQSINVEPAGTTAMVNMVFAHRSSAYGAYIAFIPREWNKPRCENFMQQNLQQIDDVIAKNITVDINGVYYATAYVIGRDGSPDRDSEPANLPMEFVIDQGIIICLAD